MWWKSKELCKILFCIFILFLLGCKNPIDVRKAEKFVSKFRKPDYSGIYNYRVPLAKILDSLNINPSDFYIDINKSNYLLSVKSDTLLLKQYPVVLGKNPVNDKLQQGDFCTPEGWFSIKAKYVHEKWSRFLWLDYPNEESLNKINKAKQSGILASDALPGGDIGIHGVEQGFDYAIDFGINWTAGCIAMKNKDVEEIYESTDNHTRVYIHK